MAVFFGLGSASERGGCHRGRGGCDRGRVCFVWPSFWKPPQKGFSWHGKTPLVPFADFG